MDDPERQELLRRCDAADKARRRWKILALAGTPILAFLLIMAVGDLILTGLANRGMGRQERLRMQDLMEAERKARMEAERARMAAEEVRGRADESLKQQPPMPKEP